MYALYAWVIVLVAGLGLVDRAGAVPQADTRTLLERFQGQTGLAQEQFNIGICYYNGKGVEQDLVEAVRWYRLAADQGDAQAQQKLRVLQKD